MLLFLFGSYICTDIDDSVKEGSTPNVSPGGPWVICGLIVASFLAVLLVFIWYRRAYCLRRKLSKCCHQSGFTDGESEKDSEKS